MYLSGQKLGLEPRPQRAGHPRPGEARTHARAFNQATADFSGIKLTRIPPIGCQHLSTATGWRPTALLKTHHADVTYCRESGRWDSDHQHRQAADVTEGVLYQRAHGAER